MRLSIRWRLTLWNTLALAVVLLGFAALVYALAERALYDQLDRRLLAAFQQMEQDERLAAEPESRLRHWVYEFLEHDRFFAVVYGPGGKVRARTEELAADSVPPPPAYENGGPHFHDMALPLIGRQRAVQAGLSAGGQDLTVVVLAPLEDVDRELTHLRRALLMAVPAALALCAAAGYLLARKALAPVDQLRRRTLEVTADRLDRRLPVANPGDELGLLAQTINDMIARLERSFAEVRRFTADASHELRTPLTAIRAEAELALSRGGATAEQQHLLGSILEECERLARLTDQLLALAREDAGLARQAWEPVDLAALARGVAEALRPLAEARGVRLHVDAAAEVRAEGDEARLRQVAVNAVDNALKHTPPGGEVEVRVEARGGEAVLIIRDTGEGIPPEHLPRVFERFYRVDRARSRAEGGTGLGLSIARSIVTAHGGRIELESAVGRGTICTVILPLRPAEANSAAGR